MRKNKDKPGVTNGDKIEWLGWPVIAEKYSGIDSGFFAGGAPPSQFVRPDIEIGLRDDGIVVWRRLTEF